MDDIKGLKAVFYTDGGCRPSRGIGGWGIHGYIFTEEKPKQGTGLKDWKVTPTGYVVDDKKTQDVSVARYLDGTGSLIPESTNNQAELTAVCQATAYALKHGLSETLILTDSKYVEKGLTEWLDGWVRRNWIKPDGNPVANRELWEELLDNRKKIDEAGHKLTITHVKGHNGDWGNEIADHNATLGVIAGQKGEAIYHMDEKESKGYWNRKISLNRMFSNTYWYFNTNTGGAPKTKDGRHIYHLGEHGSDDDFLGKRMSDASFSVIYTKNPEPVLEYVREYQDKIDVENFNSVVIGHLPNIFKPIIYQQIEDNGPLFLKQRTQKLDIYSPDEETRLTRELRPPKLAFNVLDVMNVLEVLLDQSMTDPDKYCLAVTDITELLYESSVKKEKVVTKLLPSITMAVKSLSVGVNHPLKLDEATCKITLTMGIDTPDRNTFSALASRNPRVKVITWKESPKAFRFATVVEAEDDIGIWAGFYSNIHLIT